MSKLLAFTLLLFPLFVYSGGYGSYILQLNDNVTISDYSYKLVGISPSMVALSVSNSSKVLAPWLVVRLNASVTSFNAVILLNSVNTSAANLSFAPLPRQNNSFGVTNESSYQVGGTNVSVTRAWIVSENQSKAVLVIYNRGGKRICRLLVTEFLPAGAVSNGSVSAQPPPDSVSPGSTGVVASWILKNVGPNQGRVITYSVDRPLPKEVLEKLPPTEIRDLGCEEIEVVNQPQAAPSPAAPAKAGPGLSVIPMVLAIAIIVAVLAYLRKRRMI